MRPLLKPALRRLWRDRTTVQFGVDPTRALLLCGVDRATADMLERLDGSRDLDAVLTAARKSGADPDTADTAVRLLVHAGAVVDADQRTPASAAELAPDARQRLAAALTTAELLGADPVDVMRRRRHRAVQLVGATRLTVPLGALLAASGVGRVHVADRGAVTAGDVSPAGFTAEDVARPRLTAAGEALRRAAPEVDTRPPGPRAADLVVLAGAAALDPDRAGALQDDGVAHLSCWIRETTAVVGPLVLPGRTSCLRCGDLHRIDRDPAWPALSTQLVTGRDGPPYGDPALVAVATGLAAVQALQHLDGGAPETVEGSLEFALPDCRVRRRSWPRHPGCGCTDRRGAG